MNYIEIGSRQHVSELAQRLMKALEAASGAVAQLAADPATRFRVLKFNETLARPLHAEFGGKGSAHVTLVEFVNVAFSALTSLAAIDYLLANQYAQHSFVLYRTTYRGYDFESIDGRLIAEVFSSATSEINGKLKKDIDKIKYVSNRDKFIFFSAPTAHISSRLRIPPAISVFHIAPEALLAGQFGAFKQVVS